MNAHLAPKSVSFNTKHQKENPTEKCLSEK